MKASAQRPLVIFCRRPTVRILQEQGYPATVNRHPAGRGGESCMAAHDEGPGCQQGFIAGTCERCPCRAQTGFQVQLALVDGDGGPGSWIFRGASSRIDLRERAPETYGFPPFRDRTRVT